MTEQTAAPLEIVPGLFRWTALHPEWKPPGPEGGSSEWEQIVGSVLYEAPDAVVLIDPQLPVEDREGFLAWLDRRVASRPVSILTTVSSHRRDREELAERYGGNSPRAWNAVPRGVVPKPLRGAGETVYWLPDVVALVFGDTLIGAPGGGVQLCPESWLSDVRVDRAGLAGLMRSLIELPVERLLVSHGEPVLRDGRAELARAIREAEGR
ncbi:MAG: hypothetical protein ACLQBB_03400 [Solirubrobacteraceae bacterium]